MSAMSHRQRVMKALNHQQPDRVPIDLGGTTASALVSIAYENLKRHLDVNTEMRLTQYPGLGAPGEEVLDLLGIDTRILVQPRIKGGAHWIDGVELPGCQVDGWGVGRQRTEDGRGYVVRAPLAGEPSLHDLRTYGWPDPDDLALTKGLAAVARDLHDATGRAIIMFIPARVFSLGQRLCGFEDWLVSLVARPKFAEVLLDIVVDIESEMVKNILEAVEDNVDVVFCAEDLGMQTAPLISPELYRRIIKPRHKKLFDAIKSHTRAKLLFHSDGAIAPFIGDLIDVGIDVLNPVQVSAVGMNDTAWLKREFGRDLCFWGAIDTQHVLPFGTPEEVRAEVKRRIEDLAPGGGYVLAPTHNILADVPPENVCAMVEAARQYGNYD